MVPRLEKGFDASPNTKHRVPRRNCRANFRAGPQSAEPSSCNIKKSSHLWLRKRALTKSDVGNAAEHWGNSGQPLCRSQSQTQIPVWQSIDGQNFSLRVARKAAFEQRSSFFARLLLAISYVLLVQQKGCSEFCHLLLCQAGHGFGGYWHE